jgi:hypothetical protein
MEWAACRDARLGMGVRGGGYAAGDAWYVGAHGRAPLHRATMRGVYRRAPPTIVINPSTAPTIVAPTHSPNR